MKMNKIFYGFILSIFLISLSSAQVNGNYGVGCFGPYGMMNGYGGTGIWFFGALLWILVLVALILLIAWLVKQLKEPKHMRKK